MGQNKCCIYCATNLLNNKKYVGQTVDFHKRKLQHLRTVDDTYFHRALQKDGKQNFSWEILEYCEQEQLNEREKFWIKALETFGPKGYNMTEGGDSSPIKSAVVRIKIKKSLQNPEVKTKREQSCLEKFGTTQYLASEDAKTKTKQAALSRYGVEYFSQAEEIKEKKRLTYQAHYGVDNPMQVQEIKDKAKITREQTCLEKFGVKNPLNDPTIRKRIYLTKAQKGQISPVKNIESGKYFLPMEINDWILTPLKDPANSLYNYFAGYSKACGKHPETRQSLHWERVSYDEFIANRPDLIDFI